MFIFTNNSLVKKINFDYIFYSIWVLSTCGPVGIIQEVALSEKKYFICVTSVLVFF